MPQLGSLRLAEDGRSARLVSTRDSGFELKLYLGESFTQAGQQFRIDDTFIEVAYANGVGLRIDLESVDGKLDVYRFRWQYPPKAVGLDYLKDTIKLASDASAPASWYGGPLLLSPQWPIDPAHRFPFSPYVIQDVFKSPISGQERYWLCSRRISIVVPHFVPLWVQLDNGYLALQAQEKDSPYEGFEPTRQTFLEYHLVVPASGSSAMSLCEFHRQCFDIYLKAPKKLPDKLVLEKPIWSTWAQFQKEVSQTDVEEFFEKIVDYGFAISQLELDDMWTSEYGDFEINVKKFPDFAGMVAKLQERGVRLTAWVHPFIDLESKNAKDPAIHKYFVQSAAIEGRGLESAVVEWWDGRGYAIDFTNPEAAEWYAGQLRRMQALGIYTFKFDAGEVLYLPAHFRLHNGSEPNDYSRAYAKLAARFGSAVENRVGSGTQDLSIFFRIIDRMSRWELMGLQSVIPGVLTASLHGYFWCLPDMVGGNGVDFPSQTTRPGKELFIRWAQMTTFLATMQFSFTPWDYDEEVVAICKKLLRLREKHFSYILAQCEKSVKERVPLIRPLWWFSDEQSALDSNDQFFVGDDLLVAPVLSEGEITRLVFLPDGEWRSGNDGQVYKGPVSIKVSAPLDELPHFERVNGGENFADSASLCAVI